MKNQNIQSLFITLLAACCALVSLGSFAGAPDTKPHKVQPDSLIRQCPAVKDIFKNAQNRWGVHGGLFQSFEPSAALKLKKFVGAQWQGVGVGNIFCIYFPENSDNFVVKLYFTNLVYQPSSKVWLKDKKVSALNCVSGDQKTCAFKIRPTKIDKDPYKTAEDLRQEASPNDTPSF